MKVYDASALLALLNAEPGAERVQALLDEDDGAVASVNYTEVVAKLLDRGVVAAAAEEAWSSLRLPIHAVDAALAREAALLRPATRAQGLSLADRCCLALARSLDNASVVTADRAWKGVKGFRFVFVR